MKKVLFILCTLCACSMCFAAENSEKGEIQITSDSKTVEEYNLWVNGSLQGAKCYSQLCQLFHNNLNFYHGGSFDAKRNYFKPLTSMTIDGRLFYLYRFVMTKQGGDQCINEAIRIIGTSGLTVFREYLPESIPSN